MKTEILTEKPSRRGFVQRLSLIVMAAAGGALAIDRSKRQWLRGGADVGIWALKKGERFEVREPDGASLGHFVAESAPFRNEQGVGCIMVVGE